MTSPVDRRLRELIGQGRADLPLPGHGDTIGRWRALADVATEDLALVKLFEAHADALAIRAELGADDAGTRDAAVWATWAAEPPNARVRMRLDGDTAFVSGRKAWCSGAGLVDFALVTAWDERDQQQLVAIAMDQPGIRIVEGVWAAVGMGRVPTPDVTFDQVRATPIGGPGDYTGRPGFWHGGAGIAACWYGGMLPLAAALACSQAEAPDPHVAAHLGAVDVALHSLGRLLDDAADRIDARPRDDAMELALRVRAAADQTAEVVLTRVGRALGAGPLCRDPAVAQRFADLPVIVRQTHAERDLAELGQHIASSASGWAL